MSVHNPVTETSAIRYSICRRCGKLFWDKGDYCPRCKNVRKRLNKRINRLKRRLK